MSGRATFVDPKFDPKYETKTKADTNEVRDVLTTKDYDDKSSNGQGDSSTLYKAQITKLQDMETPFITNDFTTRPADQSASAIWIVFLAYLAAANATIEDMIAAFSYDGFNPVAFIAMFYMRGIKLGKTAKEVMRDIVVLLMYAMQQGTNVNARRAQTLNNPDAMAMIRKLVNEYDIMDGVEMVNGRKMLGRSGANTITLGRLLASTPQVMSQMLIDGKVKPLTSSNAIALLYQHLNGAALIPKGDAFSDLFDRYVAWSTEATKVISRKNAKYAKKTDAEIAAEQRGWASIARDSPVLTQDERYTWMKNQAPTEWAKLAVKPVISTV